MNRRFRILVVDDDRDNILVMKSALIEEYDIYTALNGNDAISQVKEHGPDLILLDVMMPDLSGFDVCMIIKSDAAFADIPVIFLTAFDTFEGELQGLEIGGADYLGKPINFDLLKMRVRNHIALKERNELVKEQRDLLACQKIELARALSDLELQSRLQREAEAALWENRKQLTEIIEFLPDATFAIDKEKRVIIWNRAIEEMTGIPAAEMIGKGDYAYTIPFYGEARPHLIDLVFQNCEGMAVRYPDITRVGDILTAEGFCTCLYKNKGAWILCKASPLHDPSGNIIGAIESIRDITEHKQAEEDKLVLLQQFEQTQKLESLGVLAGGIAHDFNNILAIIIGYCSLIEMKYETAEKHVPEIEKAANRAAELCRQMLAYAGQASVKQGRIDMTELVDEIVEMLKSTTKKNVVIRFDSSTGIPLIHGDASQLWQVVMNLIINASEAIGMAQGEIRVSLAESAVTGDGSDKDHLGKVIPPGRYVCLDVIDNGCGMDDQTLHRIFEPFYTTKFTGRGLGMSATLGIIKAHGGALRLTSSPGRGTAFKIYLPVQVNKSAGDEASQQIPSIPWQSSGTILLVEDDEQFLCIVKYMLQELGFTVIEASNGKEALELYHKNVTDIILVVTDLGMPVMDGYELFHELKKCNPELPIIASSGFGEPVVTSRIACGSLAGLVNKPYNFEQLREVLKSVVGACAA